MEKNVGRTALNTPWEIVYVTVIVVGCGQPILHFSISLYNIL